MSKSNAIKLNEGRDFSKVSWPTRKNESFHFTPLTQLSNQEWREEEADLREVDKIIASYIEEDEYHIVFANGQLIESRTQLPPGLKLTACAPTECAACVSCDGANCVDKLDDDFLLDLNCLFSKQKWLLDIKEKTTLAAMKVIFVTVGDGVRAHPHLKIKVGNKARVKLMELHLGVGSYLSNPALLVECRQDSKCTYARVQKESFTATHLGIMRGHVYKSAQLNGFGLSVGSLLSRYDARVKLMEERAHVEVHALQSIKGAYTSDLTSVIEHKGLNCTSRQNVKSVIEAKGKGIFQGKVLIDPGAQKSDGYQMNKALFLDDTCTMDSKPELEIYADDVKCSHGCTVGALDQDKMFYLRARGIPEKQARLMLIESFVMDALNEIPKQELRSWVKKFVQ